MPVPRPALLLPLFLLLEIMVPHQVTSVHMCLVSDVRLECSAGHVILIESVFLGVSEGHNVSTSYCPNTSGKCHQPTPMVSRLCNRRQTCTLAYPRDTLINLENGCGQTNYIDMTFTCVKVSTTIHICGWSGERGAGATYIVNDNYPLAIPSQPHKCQCTIQRHPHSAALKSGVALVVRDAYLTGTSCQQKLYVEFPGHSTQSSTVCSSSQRVTRRTIFSRSSIQHGEIISLTFDKALHIADNGAFVIEVQVTGLVAIRCTTSSPFPTPSTSGSTSTSTVGPLTTVSDAAPTTPTVNPPSKTADSTSEPSSPAYQNGFTTTLVEPGADGLATGLGVGIAVGVAISVATAIVIFIIRRRKHSTSGQDDPTQTPMEQHPALDNNVTGNDNISEIPAVYDAVYEGPSDQYEQLHGVTSSTPVTYENVQGSNYEALDVPRSIDGNGPRDNPYENIQRAAEPE